MSSTAGTLAAANSYDEWGIPASANVGRFQYTGQAWLAEIGLYHYKARIYSPTLGRFLQTDPVGYDDQINLYAYVANDPVNQTDPTGTACTGSRILDGEGNCASTNAATTQSVPDDTYRERMANAGAAAGAIVGGFIGGTGGGAAGAVVCSPGGPAAAGCAAAGGVEGVAAGTAVGAVLGGMAGSALGDVIDKGIAMMNSSGEGGSGKQFNGRPGSNTAQNRQVKNAARDAGLNAGQRRQLGRAVERESRQGGGNLGYHEIRSIAEEIKSGRY